MAVATAADAGVLARARATTRPHVSSLAALLLGAGAVGALSFARGGYFPPAWSWGAVTLGWVTVMGLALSVPQRLGRPAAALVGGLAGLAAFSGLSSTWSGSASVSILSTERVGLYLVLVAAALVVVRSDTVGALVAGCWLAGSLVVAYALATHLLPDRLGVSDPVAGTRLAEPLGYWNALGCLAALTLLLALGLVDATERLAVRASAAASVPLAATTLYFTFSRGAILAGAAGLMVAVALARRPLRFTGAVIVVLAPAAGPLTLAWRSTALSRAGASPATAAAGGHRIALAVVLAMAASGVGAAAFSRVAARVRLPASLSRACAVALVALPIVGVGVGVGRAGSPSYAASALWRAFVAAPSRGTDLRSHLLSLSGSGRVVQYRMALRDFSSDPLLGSGAGTYERYWLLHRRQADKVRNVHSLYLETLAELGIVGGSLLVLALAAPLTLWRSFRRHRLGAATLGAYVAGLVHTGIDWDWQIGGVTAAVLLLGAAIVRSPATHAARPARRAVAAGAAAAALVAAFVTLVGNVSVSEAAAAARAARWNASAGFARRALSWAPWSTDGWRLLGEARLAQGDLSSARAAFRAALGRDPRDWSLWFDLARASLGREQASALAQAQRLDPLSPEVRELRQEIAAQNPITVAR